MKRLLNFLDGESRAVETYTTALIFFLVILAGIVAGLRFIGD